MIEWLYHFLFVIVWCTLGAKPRSYVLQRHDVLSMYLESNVQALNALPSSTLNESSPPVASLEHLPDDDLSSLCRCSWSPSRIAELFSGPVLL